MKTQQRNFSKSSRKILLLLLTAVVMQTPVAATAAAVTYDFAGIVNVANEPYLALQPGDMVIGTFTFDYDVGLVGSVGSSAGWSNSVSQGFTPCCDPVGAMPYTVTATVRGGVVYASAPMNAGSDDPSSSISSVTASTGVGTTQFVASDSQSFPISSTYQYSSFSISAAAPFWASDGTITLPAGAVATGIMGGSIYGTLYDFTYSITSLSLQPPPPVTPTPLPTAAWLFGSGLLGLIGVARRKAE